MAGEALTSAQNREVQQIAELETRRYFDTYLTRVWPAQQAALREYVDSTVRKHDDSDKAHGGVEMKVNRFLWTLLGVCVAGGGVGAGLTTLIQMIV